MDMYQFHKYIIWDCYQTVEIAEEVLVAALKLLNLIFDDRVIQVGFNLVCWYDKKISGYFILKL